MSGGSADRWPMGGMVVHYGAPSMPYEPSQPYPGVPFTPPGPSTAEPLTPEQIKRLFETVKLVTSETPAEPRRLRVAARKTEDGGIAVKIYVDGKMICETTVDGMSASVETDI